VVGPAPSAHAAGHAVPPAARPGQVISTELRWAGTCPLVTRGWLNASCRLR
jgi:hypothetical protein